MAILNISRHVLCSICAASGWVEACPKHACTGAAGGNLSDELQTGCPAYFKQADKTYYEASELLARAGNAAGSEQATLLSQAINLMLKVLVTPFMYAQLHHGLSHASAQACSPADGKPDTAILNEPLPQVPLACDLSRVIPQLAVRGQYAGIVSLAVRKAQALDPEEAALQPGPDGSAAQQVTSAHPTTMWRHSPEALQPAC